MKIHFWGATDDVTGSMTFLELPEGRVMIDCGLAQGMKETEDLNKLPLPYSSVEIKAVLLTHAHLDHSGYLPRLVKKGFRGKIYCTPATAKLIRIILLDSAKLNEDDFYDESDVTHTLQLIKTVDWDIKTDLLGANFRFVSAGHILGASSVVLNVSGKKYVFSGDLGRFNDPILQSHQLCPVADMIVMESTYGGKIRSGNLEKELHSFLATVAREKRVGIIASFAVARAQTLLTLIYDFYMRHPEEKIRVVIDSPMLSEANKVYREFSHLTHDSKNVMEAMEEYDVIQYQNEWDSLKKKKGPLVILSSSGMITGGRIHRHLYNWHDDESAILFLPGYQGVGTPGRGLIEGNRNLQTSNGENFEWKGEIWTSDAFSSHADHKELLEWVGLQNSNAKIFLIHGEENAKRELKRSLEGSGYSSVQIPTRGSKTEI